MGPIKHSTNGSTLTVPNTDESEAETSKSRRLSVLDEPALREDDTKLDRDQRITMITHSYQDILKGIGEDPTRQGREFRCFSSSSVLSDRISSLQVF